MGVANLPEAWEEVWIDYEILKRHSLSERTLANYRVKYKVAMARDPNQTSVPRPRTDDLDALELARIRHLDEAREVQRRVARKIQDAHIRQGTAEFTKNANAPTREESSAGLGKSAAGFEVKDGDLIEIRDGPVV